MFVGIRNDVHVIISRCLDDGGDNTVILIERRVVRSVISPELIRFKGGVHKGRRIHE